MKLEFNHVMLYATDVARSIEFYTRMLGFKLLEEQAPYYARLQSPDSKTTLALHKVEPGARGFRLYFETDKLDKLYAELQKRGVQFDREPRDEVWGWRHSYLRDPDGHEISLYTAGAKRLKAVKKKQK